MVKAGGILGIIAGVLGIIAAFVTLFFGGIGSALTDGADNTVLYMGWGGILCTFLTVVFSVIALASKKPKYFGIALILSSIGGMILGGTFVALFMILSLIGGILIIIGSKNIVTESSAENVQPATQLPQTKGSILKKIALVSGIVLVSLIAIAVIFDKSTPGGKQTLSELDQIASAEVSQIDPYGELSEIFNLNSKHTDIQRENKEKEIIGKIVVWELPVYEVSKSGDYYRVQTGGGELFSGRNPVGAFVYIKPRNEQERTYLESIKTDENIKFKGKISDVSMRSINIKPAILFSENVEPIPAPAPTPTPAVTPEAQPAQMVEPVTPNVVDLQSLKQEFARADGEINVVYNDIISKLSPGAKSELKRDQVAWIKEKENQCNSGTDEIKRLNCLIQMTNERTVIIPFEVAT